MKLNLDDILLRFWEGETSLEEEKVLKEYFRSGNIDESHRPFAPYFSWVGEQAAITSPQSSDDEMDRLLEAYWAGESTLDQEQKLKQYFAGGLIREDHKAYADLFGYFGQQRSVTYQGGKKEVPQQGAAVRSLSFKKVIYAAAAVIALVLGSVFTVKNLVTVNNDTDAKTAMYYEVEDPEEAMRITREALALVSTKFRQSQQSVKDNMEPLSKAAIFK